MERRRAARRGLGLAIAALCAACVAPASAQVKVGEPDAVKPVAYGGVQAWLREARSNGRQVQRLVLRVNTGVGRAHRLGSRRPATTDVDAYQSGRSIHRGNTSEIRVRRLRGSADCLIARRTERFSVPRNDNTVTAPVLSGGYVYWSLSGSLGTSPVRIMRVPIPGPDCRLGQVERATVDLPPISAGFAIDGAKVYYANSAGVFETDLPAFAPA